MIKLFTDDAWGDYVSWQDNKQTLKRINKLIEDIDRHPFEGLGKPEGLKYNLSGKWSRRIDQGNRLIYRVEGGSVIFYSFKDHY